MNNESHAPKDKGVNLDEYYAGKGCMCTAYDQSECGCPDVDWTPKEVYVLRAKLADHEAALKAKEEEIKALELRHEAEIQVNFDKHQQLKDKDARIAELEKVIEERGYAFQEAQNKTLLKLDKAREVIQLCSKKPYKCEHSDLAESVLKEIE